MGSLPPFSLGSRFSSANPLGSCLGTFERRQLASGPILLELQLLQLRFEMCFLPFMQVCTLGLG